MNTEVEVGVPADQLASSLQSPSPAVQVVCASVGAAGSAASRQAAVKAVAGRGRAVMVLSRRVGETSSRRAAWGVTIFPG